MRKEEEKAERAGQGRPLLYFSCDSPAGDEPESRAGGG